MSTSTRRIQGGIEAGPNAVLAFAREGYTKKNIHLGDLIDAFSYPGLWRFLGRYPKVCWDELRRSFSKELFCGTLQRLVPEIQMSDLIAGGSGVRAQAMSSEGALVDDFHFVEGEREIHVVNAPSPAATSSLAVGEEIATMLADRVSGTSVRIEVKFGPVPENPLESLALRMGKVPTPVLDVLFGPLKARVVMAGVKLGIIDTLAEAPATASQLAAALHLDEGCLEMLLRVLVHCDYLAWNGQVFSLSSLSRRTLAPGAPMDRRGFVEWGYTQWALLDNLDEMIRTGCGLDLHTTLQDPAAWGHYQRGMMDNARDHAPFLASKVPVPAGARSLIDLGGSHGRLGAAICRKHPPLRSTVFDLESALDSARELAHGEGVADVVCHRAADVLEDDLGSGHDVALLANILHHFTPQQSAGVLDKVKRALGPKGTVAIWEFERTRADAKVSGGDAAALYFRLTSSGSAYHGDEYAGWLRACGFGGLRVARSTLVPGYVLVSGRTL